MLNVIKRVREFERYHRHKRRDAKHVAKWQSEDDPKKAFYATLFSAGDTVFDVGANIGHRTRLFAEIGATVIAFEPQAFCCDVFDLAFGGRDNVTLVRKGVGPGGTAMLRPNKAREISSMSSDFIEATSKTGRFSKDYIWGEPVEVPLVSLDSAIAEFGLPRFIKIDVEGFEPQVLRSLSQPVPSLSFEFTPELIDSAFECIRYLGTLGSYRFQISLNESLEFSLPDWSSADEVRAQLSEISKQALRDEPIVSTFGDVYARLIA